MAEWKKLGMSVGTGLVAGAADQFIQNQDDKRAAEKEAAGETMTVMGQYGTYFNYGIPILTLAAAAMGWLEGDWAIRLGTASSQLAGRKITHYFTKKGEAGIAPRGEWEKRKSELEERHRREIEEARLEDARRRARPYEIINESLYA